MEEERLDLISSFPYEILLRIVSFLPLKHAVRTSILSTVWRSLWTPFQVNLNFDSDQITSHEASKEVTRVIGTFLKSYDSPEQWKLCLGFPESKKESSKIMDIELVVLATKGVDKELHLDFFEEEQMTSEFNLILESTCPNFCRRPTSETANFSSLKTLHLRSITCLAGNLVSALFSNCELLESLKLEKCTGLQSIDIKAHNYLQSLIVLDCPKMLNITVSAPNLKLFWYRGVLPWIQLKSTSNLVDVMLNLVDGPGHNEFDCEELLSLLASFKEVEILTISGWLLEWLCSAGVIFGRLEFQFNKLKELCWVDSLMDKHKRDSLACFLNISPFLEKLFVKIDRSCSSIPCPFFHHHWHEPHLWMDYTTVKSNTSQLKHLKMVKLVDFTNDDRDQLLLMDLLLKKAVALNLMTVMSPDNQSWRVVKIPRSQLKQISWCHPRKIAVSSSPDKEYFFGFTKED